MMNPCPDIIQYKEFGTRALRAYMSKSNIPYTDIIHVLSIFFERCKMGPKYDTVDRIIVYLIQYKAFKRLHTGLEIWSKMA